MNDVAKLVSGIEYKLDKFFEQLQKQRTEIKIHISEIQKLKQVVNEQKHTISQLEDKIKIVRIAKTIETKEGTVEAKLKINELVREIDKCIGLLNT